MPRTAGLSVVEAVQVADVFLGVDNDAVLGAIVIVNQVFDWGVQG